MERLKRKTETLQAEIRKIEIFRELTAKAAQIHIVNEKIMGIAQYYQSSICSHAFEIIDRRVNNTAFAVWKNMFPHSCNQMQVPLKVLCNLPHRHQDYTSTTFAIRAEGNCFGLGNAYEYLIGQFAATAGKKAGEFHTPSGPAELLCRLACLGLTDVKSAADPTCGSNIAKITQLSPNISNTSMS